jgi:hypothetical protein
VDGTVIANGTTDFVPATNADTGAPEPGSYCMTLTATSVFTEVAKNMIIGPLMSVDADAGTFVINDTKVAMNTDTRFSSDLHDTGGDPLQLADLVGHEGALMDVNGYYHAGTGTMRGTVVEADLVRAAAGKDTVQVQRASGQLRVNGVVGASKALDVWPRACRSGTAR